MRATAELFEKAYQEYITSGASIRKISSQFGINYTTFYLFLKKNKKVENKRTYGGRKKSYTDDVLEKAFADIEKGIDISLVASKYSITKSTLRCYYSLYKTNNKEVKSVNKTIERLKNKVKTKAEKTDNKLLETPSEQIRTDNTTRTSTNNTNIQMPSYYKKVNASELKITYVSMYEDLPEEYAEVEVYFMKEKNNGVMINLSFLVLIFGKREGVVKDIYNSLSTEKKIVDNTQLYNSPYREWLQKDYFPVAMFLETLRKIKSKLDIIEELRNIYLFVKQEKSTIEKILL